LTPNEHELASLIGRRPARAARGGRRQDRQANPTVAFAAARLRRDWPTRLGRLGPHLTFVITRGARGVDLFRDGTYTRNAARPPAVEVADTVGAGDCFSGALAAALARRRADLDGALRFAVAASALSVTRPGAQAAMPRRREIAALLAKTPRL
jgi:sugar/nucleoside kinase (ribokinase family)